MDLAARLAQLEGRFEALEHWLRGNVGTPPSASPSPTPRAATPAAAQTLDLGGWSDDAGGQPQAPQSSPQSSAAPTPRENAPQEPPQQQRAQPRPQPRASQPGRHQSVSAASNALPRTAPWAHAQRGTMDDDAPTASRILGFGGGLSIVLACVYLIRIAINSGVFTAAHQVGLAAITGVLLIAAGLLLKTKDRGYAAYPAGTGLAVLFLTVVAAHQHFELISDGSALAGIGLTCALGVWLDMVFANTALPTLTALAAYSAPAVVGNLTGELPRLIAYFATCACCFSAWSFATKRRGVYLTALYLGLAAFAWHSRDASWKDVVAFQVLQLVIFGAVAAMMSLRARRPMSDAEAAVHAPALAIFYLVIYSVLKHHAHEVIPFAALGSAALVAGLYYLARSSLKRTSDTMTAIVVGYVAVAVIHAVYIESVPEHLVPWFGLITGPAILFILKRMNHETRAFKALLTIVCILFVVNNGRVLTSLPEGTPAPELLRVLYAAQLWSGFYLLRDVVPLDAIRVLSLYVGHMHALVAAIVLLENRLQVSMAWGALALIVLCVGIGAKSREIGRSALLILAAAGAKGAFYDLDSSQPVLRVACLAVLGVSLFLGGWLYQKLARLDPR